MRNGPKGSWIAIATVVVGGVFSLGVAATAGQTPAYSPPRTADGRPDLNGIWQALGAAHFNIQDHVAEPGPYPHLLGAHGAVPAGKGVVEGNEIPYLPWAATKRKENYEGRMTGTPFEEPGDPELKCYLPGVPRATYMPFPFQIIQSTNRILIVYEYASSDRIIHIGKADPPPIDLWMGHSVANWDGNTLVVDVKHLNGQTWLDRAGNFMSETAHVIERYTPISAYHLMYEATIEDPKVFARPWKMKMPLYRRIDENVQLLEFKCVEFTEELLYGGLRKQPSK